MIKYFIGHFRQLNSHNKVHILQTQALKCVESYNFGQVNNSHRSKSEMNKSIAMAGNYAHSAL